MNILVFLVVHTGKMEALCLGKKDAPHYTQALENFRNRYINDVLERNGGNRTKTAKDLGVDPRTIFRHLEKEAEERGEALPASSDDALEP